MDYHSLLPPLSFILYYIARPWLRDENTRVTISSVRTGAFNLLFLGLSGGA